MRVNLTKKEIINSVFMQIGFSKKMSESILDDILSDIIKNLKKQTLDHIYKDKFMFYKFDVSSWLKFQFQLETNAGPHVQS